jgi:hypothetical protein
MLLFIFDEMCLLSYIAIVLPTIRKVHLAGTTILWRQQEDLKKPYRKKLSGSSLKRTRVVNPRQRVDG